MCDRWTSICRSWPFCKAALLFWASDTRRYPGYSDVSLCQNIWASRTELAEKRTLKLLEDTPWGEFNHRCIVCPLTAHFSHSEHHTTLFHTRPQPAWCHFPSLPYVSTSITLSMWLYSFIGILWCTSVNEGIRFGCQSQQGSGHQVQMCQYLDVPDASCWRK